MGDVIQITHILKDGTKVDSLDGYVVRREKCPEVYEVIEELNRRRTNASKDC